MSFSSKVKNEVCRISDLTKEEAVAEISAIMMGSGTLSISGNRELSFKITTENPAIARLVFKLLKNYFDIHAKIIVKRSGSLKKNNIYIALINEEMGVKRLLKETGAVKEYEGIFVFDYSIPSQIIKEDIYKRAYIRGAFLGGGSVSNPERAYHFEFVTHNEEYAKSLRDLINSYGLGSKIISRKSSFIVYIKEGDQIVDLLNIMGAHNALLHFENVRVMKDMRNNVNRIVNCETANLNKTVNAAVRQIECIRLIEDTIGLQRLPKNLRDVAELRLSYPDKSLKELGLMLNPPVGKSGVNHRLRKVEKIAKELKHKEG